MNDKSGALACPKCDSQETVKLQPAEAPAQLKCNTCGYLSEYRMALIKACAHKVTDAAAASSEKAT
ncbi:hypothetical protein [Halotalea alkalilenta]|uniref:Uncharacterized protein n=1 Tax=Halotalea alkalilenta TaxID=376489 RepID=A0A172YHU3_9GAMM|nr:hypothetical protein [Halotalea alkalilenta]ANF58712.1 hypothetical protein A5892_15585 [Halotalea alkalilenta]